MIINRRGTPWSRGGRHVRRWTRHVLVGGLAAAAGIAAPVAASGGAIDEFVIGYEELVEPGVPGPGAGEIEAPGNQDVYEFTAVRGDRIFFDNLGTSNNSLRWRGVRPDGEEFFSGAIFADRGPFDLEQTGTYTVIVDDNADEVGTYSFILRETTIEGPFAISTKQVVAPGQPAPGAGEIESPGDRDVYELDVVIGDRLFFDNLETSNNSLRWRAIDTAGEEVFSSAIFADRGPFEVLESGTWTIIVDDNGDAFGTYSFTVWEAEIDGPFPIEIETLVGPGMPAAGAGEIEEPGDEDVYEFEAGEGQTLFFQNIETSNNGLRWQLLGPDGEQLFNNAIFADIGPLVMEAGLHRLVVNDNTDDIGTYSFIIWETNVDGPFAIDIETVVGPGVPGPGAGEIEEPGDEDRYTFSGGAGQVLFFQNLETSNNGLRWRLHAPDGTELFNNAIFADIGPLVLEQDGLHEIVVDDNGEQVGTYSFIIWETDDDAFSIDLNQVVDVDDPGPGAGWIEQPGNVDRYSIEGVAGDQWCAVNLATDENGLNWRLLDPRGGVVFQAAIFADQPSLELAFDGTYVLEVYDNGDQVGTYSFLVNRTTRADVTGDCVIGFDDVLAVLAGWGPCEDPGDCPADVNQDGTVGFDDVLEVLAAWTQ